VPFQHRAEPAGQVRDNAGQKLRRADRLGKGPSDMDQFGRPEQRDRFGETAEGLVEAASRYRTEAQCKRRPRHRNQIGDPLEAKPLKTLRAIRIKA
jgi:hypothetical protein